MEKSVLTITPYAHRGLHDNIDIPENSIPAFERAVDAGYGIELDVRLTSDGEIVVFHDDNTQRLCNINARIEDIVSTDLYKFKLLGTEYTPPLLRDVLNVISGKIPLLVEVKFTLKTPTLMKKLFELLDSYKGFYSVESFNPLVLSWLKSKRPEVMRGQLASYFDNCKTPHLLLLKALFFAKFNKPHFIAYKIEDLPNKYVDNYLKREPRTLIISWTIKNKEQQDKALKYSDNFIFENIRPRTSNIE